MKVEMRFIITYHKKSAPRKQQRAHTRGQDFRTAEEPRECHTCHSQRAPLQHVRPSDAGIVDDNRGAAAAAVSACSSTPPPPPPRATTIRTLCVCGVHKYCHRQHVLLLLFAIPFSMRKRAALVPIIPSAYKRETRLRRLQALNNVHTKTKSSTVVASYA